MNNQDIHIGIVGAGRIGSAIYELLVSDNLSYKVSIADRKPPESYSSWSNNYIQLKITKPTYIGEVTQFKEFVKDKSLIINALPYTENINLFKTCFNANVPYFDLSEDNGLDNYIKRGMPSVPFTMPHCGLAPGMSTVIANHLISDFKIVKDVNIRVGALSQNATNKLRYHTSWSGDGLANEYIGDCQVVQKGTFGVVPALSGYEKITIDGHEYEAFHTSGGIGTFAKTLSDIHPSVKVDGINVNYKTLRRIGHHDYVDFLVNDLGLPQHELTKIFKNHIPTTRKDVVILYVNVRGSSTVTITGDVGIDIDTKGTNYTTTPDETHYYDTQYSERTYLKVFKPETINGRYMTAIEYTTAIGMLAMVELYLKEKLPQKGYVKQESVKLTDALYTNFGNYYRE